MTFDYSVRLLEGDARYVQIELKIPHDAPADLSLENLQRIAAIAEKALHS